MAKAKNRLKVFYKGKNVLVSGGAGFLGSNIARMLVGMGSRVTLVDPFARNCGANLFNIRGIKDKVTLVRKTIELFIDENPDAVDYDIIFNCIGLSDHHIGMEDPGLDYRLNCHAPLRILQWLKANKSGARMVSIGSRGQYGRAESRPVKESHPLNPVDIQAVHKNVFEQYNRIFSVNFGLNLTCLRATNIYGPGQRLSGSGIGFMGEIIKSAVTGDDVVIYGDLGRIKDVLFVDDAVRAVLSAGAARASGFRVYNLGAGGCRLSSIVGALKCARKAARIKVVPFPDRIKKIDTGDIVLDTARLKRDTGWSAKTTPREGIGITLGYYEKNFEKYMVK